MKKAYTKPLISVEAMTLDQPIANVNCSADGADMKDLVSFGWFAPEYECDKHVLPGDDGKGGYYDWDKDGNPEDTETGYHDTICYHSNVTVAFLS